HQLEAGAERLRHDRAHGNRRRARPAIDREAMRVHGGHVIQRAVHEKDVVAGLDERGSRHTTDGTGAVDRDRRGNRLGWISKMPHHAAIFHDCQRTEALAARAWGFGLTPSSASCPRSSAVLRPPAPEATADLLE